VFTLLLRPKTHRTAKRFQHCALFSKLFSAFVSLGFSDEDTAGYLPSSNTARKCAVLKKRLQFAGAEGLGRSSSGEKTGEEISRVAGGVDKYLLLQRRQYVHQARPTKPAGGQVKSSCA